jgi:hypothetical protein
VCPESTKAREATTEGASSGSVENTSRDFWKSLVRGFHLSEPRATREQNKVAAIEAAAETHQPVHQHRIIKQGNFDWGSFSAFEDGSIEVERNGVRQWFRTFSELKCSLSQTENRRIAGA